MAGDFHRHRQVAFAPDLRQTKARNRTEAVTKGREQGLL